MVIIMILSVIEMRIKTMKYFCKFLKNFIGKEFKN